MASFCFFVWYYPAALYRNAEYTDSVHIRAFHTVLLTVTVFLFASTFAHLLVAGSPNEDIAGAIATLMTIMLYAFCGILAGPEALPRFWIFMYRANPFTYLVSSLMSTTLGQAPVQCAESEFQTFAPPDGETCMTYMENYMSSAGGYLRDPENVDQCQFCQMDNTNQFLQHINSDWNHRWRDLGLLCVYVGFNVIAAIFLYWLFRVPKGRKAKKT
jgi:ATP-binding cassette, subfamily G (WHITE), member 2, PDR